MLPCGTFNKDYSEDIAIVRTRAQWVLLIAFLAILAVLPFIIPSDSFLAWANIAMITLVAVLGLQLLTGYCGQISIGQAAFFGVGAYTSAIFTSQLGLHFLIGLPAAIIVTGMVGLVFGLPSFRVKGFYLIVSTLAAQIIISWFFLNATPLTKGIMGLDVPVPALGGMVFDTEAKIYYIIMPVTALMTFFALNLARTSVGRSFIAVRDNDLAANIMGINVFYTKLLAFSICCVNCNMIPLLF